MLQFYGLGDAAAGDMTEPSGLVAGDDGMVNWGPPSDPGSGLVAGPDGMVAWGPPNAPAQPQSASCTSGTYWSGSACLPVAGAPGATGAPAASIWDTVGSAFSSVFGGGSKTPTTTHPAMAPAPANTILGLSPMTLGIIAVLGGVGAFLYFKK